LGSNPDATEDEIASQLEMFVDHIDPDATQEDILYELLLKSGYMPTERIEKVEMAGKSVFSVSEGKLLICLEDEISRELIDVVADASPSQFICLDKSFKGNDQLKANAVQTFAARNQSQDKSEQIVFRTV
jgi:adenine-specific DNA-methyltransferase